MKPEPMVVADVSQSNFNLDAMKNDGVIQTVTAGLTAYNLVTKPDATARPVTLAVHDDQGQVRAGLIGRVGWGWLRIDVLWVDDSIRGHGLGKQLMERAEEIARAEGCRGIHLTTFEFQAPGLYLGLGYEIFGRLDDYPDGPNYFMMKRL